MDKKRHAVEALAAKLDSILNSVDAKVVPMKRA
jgi:hypothetical protein